MTLFGGYKRIVHRLTQNLPVPEPAFKVLTGAGRDGGLLDNADLPLLLCYFYP
jgi:hypothetical protein